MLAGFLTTALEIILILDICGAVIYFIVTGFSRANKARAGNAALSLRTAIPAPIHPFSAQTAAGVSLPGISGASALDVYGRPASSSGQNQRKHAGIVAGFKDRIVFFRDKFIYRPASGGRGIEKQSQGEDHRKLGRILDSFREET